MIKKRSAQVAALACAGCVAVCLFALPATASAKAKTAQFTKCVNMAVPIPDGPPPDTTATNPVASFAMFVNTPKFKGRAQDGTITAFHTAGVRISHSDDGDLALFLVSPGGRAVALATYRDQSNNLDDEGEPSPSGDGYGTGASNCSGSRVDFGDRFPTSIATPGNTGLDTPITGAFSPEQPLSAFVGGPARGFWTLVAQDIQFQDVGQIDALSLSFTYAYKAKKKKRKKR